MKIAILCLSAFIMAPVLLSAQDKPALVPAKPSAVKISAKAADKKAEAYPSKVSGADLAQSTVPAKPVYEKKASWFSIPSIDGGKNIDLQNYSDRPVMVIMFSADCHFCRKAAPFFQKVSGLYGDRGLAVIGVSLDDNAASVKAFAKDYGVSFPIGRDPERRVARAYRTRGVPWVTLLDKNHNFHKSWIGYTQEYDEEILKTVEAVLK